MCGCPGGAPRTISGGQAVPEGATIEIRKAEAGPDGTYEWIGTEYAMPTRFKVPAGKYLIVVIRDYATTSVTVEVTAANTTKTLVDLQAGYLAVTGPNDSTSFEIYAAEKDLSGVRKQIGTEFYGTFNKAFTAGAYHVITKSADGAVIAETDVVVKPGERTEAKVP